MVMEKPMVDFCGVCDISTWKPKPQGNVSLDKRFQTTIWPSPKTDRGVNKSASSSNIKVDHPGGTERIDPCMCESGDRKEMFCPSWKAEPH